MTHLRSIVLFQLLLLIGCAQHTRNFTPATKPSGQIVQTVSARCYPPEAWKPEPLKSSDRHTHQIWISPTGHTAYGVAHFTLPIPVGGDIVLFFFLQEMKNHEGEAHLLSKQWDASTLHFKAQGGHYTVRANLQVRGLEGWIAYAGTRTDETVIPSELDQAAAARDQTQFGVGKP